MFRNEKWMTPQVGTPVQFWPSGSKGEPDIVPIAAIVTRKGHSGQVRLRLLHENGGEVPAASGFIRWHGDAWVKSNIASLRKPHNGQLRGTWDWIPGMLPEFVPDDELAVSSDTIRRRDALLPNISPDKGLEKVEKMLKEGSEPEAIKRAVRTYGLSGDDVDAHIESLRETAPA